MEVKKKAGSPPVYPVTGKFTVPLVNVRRLSYDISYRQCRQSLGVFLQQQLVIVNGIL